MKLAEDIAAFVSSLSQRPNRPLVLWGAGSMAAQVHTALRDSGREVIAFVDGAEQRCGETIDGVPIVRPDDLSALMAHDALVAVASTWWREIGMDLINRGLAYGRDFVLVQRAASNVAWRADALHEPPVFIGRKTGNCEGLLAYYPLARPRQIGAFCSIAAGTRLGANHVLDAVTSHPFITHKHHGIVPEDRFELYAPYNPPITIGNDVWLGYNSCIMPGVTVGDGAIVGAGAVVTADVPAYGIAVGSPAKVVRFRFSEAEIALLQEIRWWTWSDTMLRRHVEAFRDPRRFFALLRETRDKARH